MATYLQGVQDYIPQIQPAQPDFNFYNTVLQTKQNQYDTNYKKLNKLYGQLYYADLTREDNIEKREQLVKDIDFNLKRVAGLDLSLEQNMTQATQLFKPFYEDKVLVKDMAWTKNYMNQRSRAEGMKNATNKELREQYWETGVRAMDYMREEFAATSDEESMNFRNTSYTPYTNVMKLAGEIAKEFGDIEAAPEISPDGKWIIKRRNGQVLLDPLNKLFEAQLGNDPSIQAIYQTQAYVDRKDYAYGNAAQFGGDKEAAEMDYLQKNYQMLVDMNNKRKQELDTSSKTADARKKAVEQQMKDGKALPDAQDYLNSVLESLNVNQALYAKEEALSEDLGTGSATLTTSSGFKNPYGDIESLRRKVDAGMSSLLMQKDLGEAAQVYAMRNAKTDIVANPYGVLAAKHANDLRAIRARKKADSDNIKLKHNLDNGTWILDEKGNPRLNEALYYAQSRQRDDASTGQQDMLETSAKAMQESFEGTTRTQVVSGTKYKINGQWVTDRELNPAMIKQLEDAGVESQPYEGRIEINSQPRSYAMKVYSMVRDGVADNTISLNDARSLLGIGEDVSLQDFKKNIDERGVDYIEELALKKGPDQFDYFGGLTGRVNEFISANNSLPVVQSYANDISSLGRNIGDYGQIMQDWGEWKKSVYENVIKENPDLKMYFDDSYDLIPSKDIIEKLPERLVLEEREGPGLMTTILNGVSTLLNLSNPMTFGLNFSAKKPEPEDWKKSDLQMINELVASYKDYKGSYGLDPTIKRDAIGEALAYINPRTPANMVYSAKKAVTSKIEEQARNLERMLSDTNTYDKAPPYIPGLTAGRGGTGLTSMNSAIQVNAQTYATPGKIAFNQFADNYLSADYKAEDFSISYKGADALSYEEGTDVDSKTAKHALLTSLINDVRDPTKEVPIFEMEAQFLAAGDPTKSAMRITPRREWLEDNLVGEGEDSKEIKANQEAMISDILANGITLIANSDHSIFNNSLYKGGTMDPATARLEYEGKYEYEDPMGNGGYVLEKDDASPTGYRMRSHLNIFDVDQGKMIMQEQYNQSVDGTSLNLKHDDFLGLVQLAEEENKKRYQAYNNQ